MLTNSDSVSGMGGFGSAETDIISQTNFQSRTASHFVSLVEPIIILKIIGEGRNVNLGNEHGQTKPHRNKQ